MNRAERVTEARAVEGDRTFDEIRAAVGDAICDHVKAASGAEWVDVWVRDLSDTWVVYCINGDDLYRVDYSIDDAGAVTLTGAPQPVEARTEYVPDTDTAADSGAPPAPAPEPTMATTEAKNRDRVGGRVLESKGTTADGGRVFGVQIIAVGTSRNGVRYPESVLRTAAPLYESAKAFDHHRTEAELRSSSITGLVGYYRNVEATADGLFADLHLLASATHTAEALDASISAQAEGLPPVVGISHDVQLASTPVVEGGRRIREATAIAAVLSADVVADPSAGGRATRVVAGGIGSDPTPNPSQEDNMTLKELIAKLREATPEARAELLTEHAAVLTDAGITAEDIGYQADGSPITATTATPPAEPAATEDEPVLTGVAESFKRGSIVGKLIRDNALTAAGLDGRFAESVDNLLPDEFTEADLTRVVRSAQRTVESVEANGLRPKAGHHVRAGEDNLDKKRARLDATFRGDWQNGYTRLSEAYTDITGEPYRPMTSEFASAIIRESWAGPFVDGRMTESIASTSWGQVLADAMNRRLVELYQGSTWNQWRKLVNIFPVTDFRSQKLIQVGEFAGPLPTVNEGAPYQALTSPADQQETYTPTKKGGTEDYTWEAAKNDDLRALVGIPAKLARVAAWTVYKTVFDIFTANAALGADSTTLFHANHGNTAALALSQTNLSTIRQKMRDQAAYGDTGRALGLLPKYLLVPNELEELAFQLCTSAVAVPSTPAGPSDTPNIHAGRMEPIVVDYWTDANDWYATCDPADHPLIELGFMDGKVDPELFMQDDPTTGSVFSADKVTWKIRHTYGYGVVDYRGFQRGTQ